MAGCLMTCFYVDDGCNGVVDGEVTVAALFLNVELAGEVDEKRENRLFQGQRRVFLRIGKIMI